MVQDSKIPQHSELNALFVLCLNCLPSSNLFLCAFFCFVFCQQESYKKWDLQRTKPSEDRRKSHGVINAKNVKFYDGDSVTRTDYQKWPINPYRPITGRRPSSGAFPGQRINTASSYNDAYKKHPYNDPSNCPCVKKNLDRHSKANGHHHYFTMRKDDQQNEQYESVTASADGNILYFNQDDNDKTPKPPQSQINDDSKSNESQSPPLEPQNSDNGNNKSTQTLKM